MGKVNDCLGIQIQGSGHGSGEAASSEVSVKGNVSEQNMDKDSSRGCVKQKQGTVGKSGNSAACLSHMVKAILCSCDL